MGYIQLSLFGKTSWERFLQMTGWTLEPCCSRSQTAKFQCLILEDGQAPAWCEGERLTCAGASWMPDIGESPRLHSGGSESSSWQILEGNAPQKYYLNPTACSHFLCLAQTTGCPPPEPVEYLLKKQGGRYPSSSPFTPGVCAVRQKKKTKQDSSQVSDGQMSLSPLSLQGR